MNVKERYCLECINGNLEEVIKLTSQDPSLVNTKGSVHPDHIDYMKSENADKGWSPLHLSAHYGQVGVSRFLIENGAEINAVSDNDIGNTPIMSAIAGGRKEIVAILIENGADLTFKDKAGVTPERLAEIEHKPEIAKLIQQVRTRC